MKFSFFRTAIEGFDLDTDIFSVGLRVLDKNVEISIVIKYAGIDEFVLRTGAPAQAILVYQFRIWEFPLRILVEHLHVAVGRSVVEIEVVFLYVLTTIAFNGGETEVALLEDGIASVP